MHEVQGEEEDKKEKVDKNDKKNDIKVENIENEGIKIKENDTKKLQQEKDIKN